MLTFMDFGESGNDVSGLGDFRVDRRFVPDGFEFAVEPLTVEEVGGL